jgi:hypothetical protein
MALYLLSAYNFLSDVLKTVVSGAGTLTNAVSNYLNGTSNEWYFVDGTGIIPAVAYNIPSASYKDRILWIYNVFRNTLVQKYGGVQPVAVKCNWLSTQLIADGTTYTLDDWLRELYLVIDDYDTFTVGVLIDAWSVQHKIWPSDDAELHIIDSEGESHVFSITEPINEEWSALVPKPRVEEELYLADDEEEEETEEGEETEEDTDETPLLDTPAPVEPLMETPSPVETLAAPVVASVEAPTPVEPSAELPTPVVASVDPEMVPLPQSPVPEEAVSNE